MAALRGTVSLDTQVIEEPTTALAHRLLAFWHGFRARNILPARSDLPCRALAPVLPKMILYEPHGPAPADWRIRLMGTELVNRFGLNAAGRPIDAVYSADQSDRLIAAFEQVCQTLQPRCAAGRILGLDRDVVQFESVTLPILERPAGDLWIATAIFVMPGPASPPAQSPGVSAG